MVHKFDLLLADCDIDAAVLVDAMCEAAREGIEMTTKPQPTGKCEVCGQALRDTSRRWFVCSDNEVCRMTALVVALRFFGAVDSAR